MIYPAKHNGIDFSGNFARENQLYNFDSQRKKCVLPSQTIQYLSFRVTEPIDITTAKLVVISNSGNHTVLTAQRTNEAVGDDYNVYFKLIDDDLPVGQDVCFAFSVDSLTIYSELYHIIDSNALVSSEICTVVAANANNKHGFLTKEAFGFFKISKFKSDIFLNKKIEYAYSYSRKKILSSENQIGKRFTFLDLTMYNANLLKWLCNCEILYIDGVSYQLISDFTEIETDDNTETRSVRADFVEVAQSFFGDSSDQIPTNAFPSEFFFLKASCRRTPIGLVIFDDTFDDTFN